MMTQKKLMVIVGGTYIYGAEKVTLDVIDGLKQQGYEVNAVISGWNNGQFAKALDRLTVKHYRLKLGWYYVSKISWSLDSLVHYPGAVLKFLRIRKQFKGWPVYITSFRQVILLWPFFKKDIVYHVHDANAGSRQSRFFLKIIDKKIARFIAVSKFIKEDLIACGISSNKIEIIYNGVEVLPQLQKKRNDLTTLTIGIVGQVIERKGHVTLLQALRLLIEKELNIQLIIAGGGDAGFIEKLKTMIADLNLTDKIVWREFKTGLQDIYENIDIVVAPTITPEPFGLVAIEANMFAIPVIATDSGGFKETVNEGENGFLVQPENAEQLAEKIEIFYNNRHALVVMGNKGRENVLQHFDKKTMTTQIDKLLTDL